VCLKNYGWRFITLYRRQQKKAVPNKKKRSKSQGREGKVHPTKCRVPKKIKETQKGLS